MKCEVEQEIINNDGGDGGKDETERYGNLLDPKDAKSKNLLDRKGTNLRVLLST